MSRRRPQRHKKVWYLESQSGEAEYEHRKMLGMEAVESDGRMNAGCLEPDLPYTLPEKLKVYWTLTDWVDLVLLRLTGVRKLPLP